MGKYVTKDGLMSFYSWMICRHYGKDTPAGDLSWDMTYDRNWPEDNSYKAIHDHLAYAPGVFSHEPCLCVFERCWKNYQKFVKNYRINH